VAGRDLDKLTAATTIAATSPAFGSVSKAADAAAASYRAFGQSAAEVPAVLSSIASLSREYGVDAAELTGALQKSGRAWKELGGSVESYLATVSLAKSKTGESGQAIGQGLNQVLTRVRRPETQRTLSAYGVSVTDESGRLLRPDEIIRRVGTAVGGLPGNDPRASSILAAVGSARNQNRELGIFGPGEDLDRALAVSRAGDTILSAQSQQAVDSLSGRLRQLREDSLNMVRSLADNTAIKSFAGGLLDVSQAATQVSKTLVGLTPVIAALGLKLSGLNLSALTSGGGALTGLGGVLGRNKLLVGLGAAAAGASIADSFGLGGTAQGVAQGEVSPSRFFANAALSGTATGAATGAFLGGPFGAAAGAALGLATSLRSASQEVDRCPMPSAVRLNIFVSSPAPARLTRTQR
jgi:TP901 family phage tail tape measure protein